MPGHDHRETHVGTDGLFIPPEFRDFDRQIVIRTPRSTIQHYGNQPLDSYYGMVDRSDFRPVEEIPLPQNPRLAPDRVQIKPEGEDAVTFRVRFAAAEADA